MGTDEISWAWARKGDGRITHCQATGDPSSSAPLSASPSEPRLASLSTRGNEDGRISSCCRGSCSFIRLDGITGMAFTAQCYAEWRLPVTFFAVTQTGVSRGSAVWREGEDAEMRL
ncbi:hypothetical protein E2C01_027929 [Portunus trituberculatus]|uniref:Uncharacterized protein n=1 Tax=Portunus trituberculatus TaxID=210409 RepID=A0A5B7EMN9_PORTR|nr:hypothetical protein [Portunus trituberculatus]